MISQSALVYNNNISLVIPGVVTDSRRADFSIIKLKRKITSRWKLLKPHEIFQMA